MDELRNKADYAHRDNTQHVAEANQLRAQLMKNQEAYARLLQKISQDLMLPMNGVIGAIHENKATNLGPHAKGKEEAMRSVSNLMSVVQGMSVLAALLQDELRTDVKEFSIKKLFEEIVSTHQPLAIAKRVEFTSKYYSELPENAEGDFAHLKLVLASLVSNAIKFTKEGWIQLTAEQTGTQEEEITVRFKVADSGKGIGEEKQKQIREALEKASILEILSTNEVGMGLILARLLSKVLRGSFGFSSEKDVGSSFWIDVPLHPVANSAKVKKSETHPFSAKKKRKILLVEDNYLNQKFVAAALLKAGHSIEIAENGKVAMEKYRSKAYDLILMDIQMPLVDGLETTKRIRKEEKKYKKPPIPIIAVTAYAIEHDKQKCLAAGMDEYLTKPFKPLELLQVIDDL